VIGKLGEFGYLELFLRAEDTAVDEVWNARGGPEELRRLVADPRAPTPARFLAAEVLFARDPRFPDGFDSAMLAEIYAGALATGVTGMANPWGLPGQLNEPVVLHAMALGTAAVPAFAALLGDGTQVLYGGSHEATVGNSYHYRVKDIAASLVAGILGIDYPMHTDPAVRDTEIERLRQRIR
jgi:hypothetical protein